MVIERLEAHLVHSHSAAGSLRSILRDRRGVICSGDTPDLGPLHDGRARSRFFRDLWNDPEGEPDWLPEDFFAVWDEIARDLKTMSAKRLLISASPSGADFVFQRMAAHFLKGYAGELWRVAVPPLHDTASVAHYLGHQLLPLRETAVPIDDAERSELAGEFGVIAARPELLRLADAEGNLSFHGLDCYDQAIVHYCNPEWRRAHYVVGMVMGYADGLNPVGDLLIAARLRHLGRGGRNRSTRPCGRFHP